MKLLALSGSLRRTSYNTAAIQALKRLAPTSIEIVIGDISSLPLFNPDIENNEIPAVLALKSNLAQASGLIIASPEYAHGVTGTIKNALDWLVGHIPFANKPVAVLNPSHRSQYADDALRETLITMAAQLIPGACLQIPSTNCTLSAEEMAASASFSKTICTALLAMEVFVHDGPITSNG